MGHEDELWQEYNMRGEPIEGVGHPIGTDGYVYCGVLVWLYRDTDDGRELLFQLRSPHIVSGNFWDVSAGGHVNLNETLVGAAVRETREEIGAEIDPEKLAFAFSWKSPGIHGIGHTFLYDYTGQPEDFHFDDHEVSDLKWVPLDKLDDFLKNGGVKPELLKSDFNWPLFRKHLEYHEN